MLSVSQVYWFTMMTGNLLLWLQFIFVVMVKSDTFFHDPSCIEIEPNEQATDFGSTLAYHPKTHSLVAGAPFSNRNGKVYLCGINDDVLKTRKIMCKQIPIDISKEVPNYSRSKSSNQFFGCGASISVTPEHIFICAPLLTLDIPTQNGTKFGACGTCFISDGTSTNRSIGMVEQYVEDMNTKNTSNIGINDFYGGVGWSTLPDVDNKLILISKPMPFSSLHFIDMDQPRNFKVVDAVVEADYTYMGGSLALGKFFKGYPKLYAFSADTDLRLGSVAFLSYNDREKKMELLKDGNSTPKVVMLKDTKIGTMFGAALHSANLDSDDYTDLLVGAPALVYIEGSYETGAIYIYMGGVLLDDFPRLKTLCLYSNKDASRFGSSIATSDLDGDGYPEIFVGAPYENDGKGTVYIFSGYEVNRFLVGKKTSDSQSVPISDLLYTQIIQNTGVQTLGFSLQALPMTNLVEGGNLLAMGSLASGKVALYRSIPFITVNVEAHLKGVDRVREVDENFTVSVTVSITYPTNVTLTGKIIVTTRVEGDAAWIERGSSYAIMLSKKELQHVTDVVVSLGNYKRGLYKFNATVQPDTENLKRKDFDASLVGISPRSNTTVELNLMRECQGEDCMPDLSLTFQWSGSNKTHYTIGSTETETMSLIVRNVGGATFGSCARIKITGAKVALLECNKEEGWYKCDLTDIERYTSRSIPIRLDMSKPTNEERSLQVDVVLFNNCSSLPNSKNYTEIIAYDFNTDNIYFNSTSFNRIITDVEMQNVEASPFINVNELYTVTNDGYMSWNTLPLEIHLQEDTFIKDYLIQVEGGNCTKVDLELKYNCRVDLKPNSTIKIQGTVTLVKDKIQLESLVNGTFKVVSHLKMNMEPTSKTYEKMFLTKFVYQKTKNNMYIVIAIAVLLGVFVMAIIVIALSMGGFFKRKEKEELFHLKHEIRKQSIRRPAIDDLPPCLIPPKSDQEEDHGESVGTSSSEKPDTVDDDSQQKVPEVSGSYWNLVTETSGTYCSARRGDN